MPKTMPADPKQQAATAERKRQQGCAHELSQMGDGGKMTCCACGRTVDDKGRASS